MSFRDLYFLAKLTRPCPPRKKRKVESQTAIKRRKKQRKTRKRRVKRARNPRRRLET